MRQRQEAVCKALKPNQYGLCTIKSGVVLTTHSSFDNFNFYRNNSITTSLQYKRTSIGLPILNLTRLLFFHNWHNTVCQITVVIHKRKKLLKQNYSYMLQSGK